MPLSKKRDRERKKIERAKKKAGSTALLPKALVRRLHRLGVSPARYVQRVPVSLDDYRNLERKLDAKTQRVEWQSGGIRQMHQEIARLRAVLATQAAMGDMVLAQRITQLEAAMALREARESGVGELT